MDVMMRQMKDLNKKQKLSLLRRIHDNPKKFIDDPVLGIIAEEAPLQMRDITELLTRTLGVADEE